MNLDHGTIEKIAHLARLEVNDVDKDALLHDMNHILTFMDKLNELETEGVEPLIYLTEEVNVFRDDRVASEITVPEALKNAPSHDGAHFRVAKMMEKASANL